MCLHYKIYSKIKDKLVCVTCNIQHIPHWHPSTYCFKQHLSQTFQYSMCRVSIFSEAWLSSFQRNVGKRGKNAKETFIVKRLILHTVNLSTKIRHVSFCADFFAWILLENTLWCDQMLRSSSSPTISGNSKWVEVKTSYDGISLWFFLLLFWRKMMKNKENLKKF